MASDTPRRAAFLLALTLVGCDVGGGVRSESFAVRDSAGIRIAESGGPAWAEGEGWSLSQRPTVEIGVADGAPEYLLTRVMSGFRTATGAIVLENRGSQEIRLYDASGRHLRSFGGPGDGPGEFQRLGWIARLEGDSILAYDHGAVRHTVFSPDGALVRTERFVSDDAYPQVIGAFRDGSVVVDDYLPSSNPNYEPGIVAREPELFLHYSADGTFADTIALHPGSERAYELSVIPGRGTGIRTTAPLFGREQIRAVTADRLIVGSNDSYEIDIFTPGGRHETRIRRLLPSRPVTDAELDRAVSALLEGDSDPRRRRSVEAQRELVASGATMPFYNRFLGDESGNIWVQEFAPADPDPDAWTVFDREGRMLGSVMLPDRFRPLHIDDASILGVWRDDLDVERVQVYALVKP
jgi:hypothetical protein